MVENESEAGRCASQHGLERFETEICQGVESEIANNGRYDEKLGLV